MSTDENKAARDAGLTGGTVFTHTPEGGIDGFGTTLSADTFRAFHTFRTTEVEGDSVTAVTSLEQVFQLAQVSDSYYYYYYYYYYCY